MNYFQRLSAVAALAATAWAFVISFAVVLWIVAVVILGAIQDARAHDIYNGLRDPAGMLCCGGDPVAGDCEALAYEVHVDGSATFHSRRYGGEVLVPAHRITWLPVPGGEAFEAHWCGRPRAKMVMGNGSSAPPDADQPDPNFWTYCAFIAPGGV